MKIATTIGEMFPYVNSPADAVKAYEGSGFRFLDYSFYHAHRQGDPFMEDGWEELIRDVKKAADELGFTFVQAHAPDYNPMDVNADHERGREALHRSIVACNMLGIKRMVIHPSHSFDYPYPSAQEAYFKFNKDFFETIIPDLEKYDVMILLENSCEANMGGKYFPMTAAELNAMLAYIDHPRFGACWDIGHSNIQGLDLHDSLVELGTNLKALHIHDNNGQRDQHQAPYTGTVNYDELMRGIIDSGFNGYFTYEADGYYNKRKGDPMPTLEIKQAVVKLLYQIAKDLLKKFDMYEC